MPTAVLLLEDAFNKHQQVR